MTAEQYHELLEQDFGDVKLEDMEDLSEYKVNQNLSVEERKKQYIKKVGNPYMVRVGNVKVKIRFANNGISFEDAFENMLMSI